MRLLLVDLAGQFYPRWHAGADKEISYARTWTLHRVRHVAEDFDRVAICCEGHGPTWRKEKFSDYKANREAPPANLKEELRQTEEACGAEGWHVLRRDGYEADDLIASLADWACENGHTATILSDDRAGVTMTAWNNDAMRRTAALGKMHEHLPTAPTEPAPTAAPFHTCPVCGETYATEADWLACPFPSNGRQYQADGAGGWLRMRLCASCLTSMAIQVADPDAVLDDAQAEAEVWSAAAAGLSGYAKAVAAEPAELRSALVALLPALPRCESCKRQPATYRYTLTGSLDCDGCVDLDGTDAEPLPHAQAVRVAQRVPS